MEQNGSRLHLNTQPKDRKGYGSLNAVRARGVVIVCRKPLFAAQMVCLMSGDISQKTFRSLNKSCQ